MSNIRLNSILSFSFFITKKMKTDLHEGQLNGAMPLLYVFLARSGMTIKNVSAVALDEKGNAYFANENVGANATRGVRIVFAGSDGVEKTLYYFSTDLSDSGVRSSGFLKFCATLAPGNSLIKSASYLHAFRQFLDGARFHSRQQRNHHPGRFRNSARLLQPEEMALLSVRPLRRSDRQVSRDDTSNPMPSFFAAPSRWISASAIAGVHMNRICCCRSVCPTMVR